MESKTLKDIKFPEQSYRQGEEGYICPKKIIREEAIKIRKKIWNQETSSDEEALVNGGICGFIDAFFNLTEADL